MAIILPHSIFYHIPKTGGTWVRELLEDIKLSCGYFRKVSEDRMGLSNHHVTPDQVPSTCSTGKKSFAFVREPVDWYKSYWSYKKTNGGWDLNSFIDKECQAEDFDTFVKNCLNEFPRGLVTSIYKRFMDSDLTGIDYIGLKENIREDLIKFLHYCDEDFDENSVRNFPTKNVSNKDEKRDPSEEVFRLIQQKEHWVYENFYPDLI